MKLGLIGRVSVVVAGVVLAGCGEREGIGEREFLGEWEALSRNHLSILGKMEVGAGKVGFERTGESAFEVIGFDGEEYLLRLDRGLGETRIMRLGPIRRGEGVLAGADIEVAFYDSEQQARAPRKRRSSGASSWGIYFRE